MHFAYRQVTLPATLRIHVLPLKLHGDVWCGTDVCSFVAYDEIEWKTALICIFFGLSCVCKEKSKQAIKDNPTNI